MKNTIRLFISICLFMALLSAILMGCNKDLDDDDNSSGIVSSNGRTILTLATFNKSYIVDNAVVEFNSTNHEYYIQITDYSEFNTGDDQYAGLLRLSTELISGSYPDILDVTNIPYKEYAARGLLADIYPFIDSDPEFNRGDFIEGPYQAAEIDGKLYQLFPYFYVNTIVGNPYIVGTETDWSIAEFKNKLDAHPEADMPLGDWLTKTNFLQTAVSLGIDKFIDWSSGSVNFNTPEFIQLLEVSASLPDDPNWNSMYIGDGGVIIQSVSTDKAVAAGRQIMSEATLGGFNFYQYYKAIYGGDIVFKGFPNDAGSGNSFAVESSFAIIEPSPNKDGAWAFVRTILDKDWQLNNGSPIHGFPTNRAAFDERVVMELEVDYSDGINDISVENLTYADVDKVVNLINSASGTSGWLLDRTLWDIISKSIAEYYKGNVSAQSTADVIQSGVTIYMSERS